MDITGRHEDPAQATSRGRVTSRGHSPSVTETSLVSAGTNQDVPAGEGDQNRIKSWRTLTDFHLDLRGFSQMFSWEVAGVDSVVLDRGRVDLDGSISMFQGVGKMGNSSVKPGVLTRTAVVVVNAGVVHEHLHVSILLPVKQLVGQVLVGPETFQNKVLSLFHKDDRGCNTNTQKLKHGPGLVLLTCTWKQVLTAEEHLIQF